MIFLLKKMNLTFKLLIIILSCLTHAVLSQPIVKRDTLSRVADYALSSSNLTNLRVRGRLFVNEYSVVFSVQKDSAFLAENRFYYFNQYIKDVSIKIPTIKRVKKGFDFSPFNFRSALVIITNENRKYKFYRVKNKKKSFLI